MSSPPLLSIAIPVYNGEKSIGLTLSAIYDLRSELSDCEVVISDNHSDDRTAEIVSHYKTMLPNVIKYFRNPVNLGYDKNIDMLVKHFAGKYVWFMGCGEKITPLAISNINSQLAQDEYSTIVVNFDVYSEADGGAVSKLSSDIASDQKTSSKEDFSFPRYSAAVSGNIVNRKIWLKISKRPLLEVGWCHIERMLDIIGDPGCEKSLFISTKCFTLLRDADGWWTKENSYLLMLHLKHIRIIRSMPEKGFSKATSKTLEDKLCGFTLWRAVLQSKSFGMKFNLSILKTMIQMFAHKAFFWTLIFPTLFVPSSLLVFARKIKRS
jgi:glycosyltransferase involved in cell wall biosynthesis